MKKKRALLVLIIAGWIITPSYAQEKESVGSQLERALEKRLFTICVNRAIPQSGESRFVTSEFTLTVRNDSIFSHLPYFGIAYSIPYGGKIVLLFEAPLNYFFSSCSRMRLVKVNRVSFHTFLLHNELKEQICLEQKKTRHKEGKFYSTNI